MRQYVTALVVILASCAASAGVFTGDWLELIDTSKLPVLREDQCLQVSSYDRTGGNDDGFSGQFSAIREEADGAQVIFEDTGPGCIYRIWSANPGARRIEFYFDGETSPRLAFDKWEDMFLGNVEPFLPPVSHNVLGGWCSYVPLPYEKSLKIVTRERINFYQITYMKFANGEGVTTFSPQLSDENRAKFARVCAAWSAPGENPWPDPAAKAQYQKWSLAPGQRQTVASRKGPGLITALELAFEALPEKALRQVILEVSADGAEPQVAVPLGDFFLQGFPGQETQSLLCGRKPGAPDTFYCYWPMPFRGTIDIALKNESAERVRLKATTATALLREFPEELGYFHAQWQRQNPTTPGELFPILDVQGRGHWCGVSMAMQGFVPGLGFLEGDEMLWIDDRDNTAYNGTGSEDYYNGGWYFGGTGSIPYYGCGYHMESEGRCHAYRLHMTDLVPFQKQARIGIEHGHANEYEADYAGTTFWYGAPDAVSAAAALPDAPGRMWTAPRLADYLEAEDLLAGGQGARVQEDTALEETFSGGKGVLVEGPGATAVLNLNIEQDDLYQVLLRIPETSKGFDLTAQVDSVPPASLVWKRRAADATITERLLPYARLAPGPHALALFVHDGSLLLDAIRVIPSEKAPGVLEAEALEAAPVGDAAIRRVDLEPSGMSGLSAGVVTHRGEESGADFSWTAEAGGVYAAGLRLYMSPSQPSIVLTLDGAPLGDPIGYAGGDPGWQLVYQISPPIDPGEHRIGFRLAPGQAPGGETWVDFAEIRPEGVIEGEELRAVGGATGSLQVQDMNAFGTQWSRNAHAWFTPPSAEAQITFEFPVYREGVRNVCAFFTLAPDYGIYQVLVDGTPIGVPFDGYAGGVVRSDKVCLSSVDLKAGTHQITFQCMGKNEHSTGHMLGLDLLLIE